jgi:ribosomal protein S18 acetylase RimI-like enzyme
MQPDRVVVRPARPGDAVEAAELLLDLPRGLVEMLGDPPAARRAAGAAFRSRRSVFGSDRTHVAEIDGRVVGLVVTVPGPEWPRRRVLTGVAILLGAGLRRAWRVVRRGPFQELLVPPVPPDALHIVAVCVRPDRRGSGIGSRLLRHAIGEAETGRFGRVTLDVGSENAGAIRLYERLGFAAVSEHHRPAGRGLPPATSARMERAVERETRPA